jgi:acetyltransferase-like isoleucine patch superfamily enzyme
MLNALKSFKFYLKYYLTNHVINRIPFHAIRLLWYRHFMQIKIGPHSQVLLGCQFFGDTINQIEIGAHSILSSGVVINASAPVKIGDHAILTYGVQVITADHDCQDPLFSYRTAPVNISSRAWIGTRALILKGVTIGEGAVVTAGAVVWQDVKPFAIVAGNPARQVSTRVEPSSKALAEAAKPPLFC